MKNNDYIKIRGAKLHNLKNVSVNIPRNKLVCVTGLSGSGKSSLVFDTLYAEGQRRYVESLSAYARQFLGMMEKPDVERIEGISPAISIDQRKSSYNPRSTVGTVTEIYDYLRLLFARIGRPHCPKCGKPVLRQTIDQIVEQVLALPKGAEFLVLGPVIRGKKGEHKVVFQEIEKSGFVRVRVDGFLQRIEEALSRELERHKKHNIEVVVDRLVAGNDMDRPRLVDSLETALKLGKGVAIVSLKKQRKEKDFYKDIIFSEHFACEDCGISLPELEPRLFSFNSPFGACPACQGLGEKLEVSPDLVVPNPDLSVAEGALFPWAKASHKIGRQGFFFRKLEEVAGAFHFSLDNPFRSLSKEAKDILLFGNGFFEGIIPWLERRYHETESDYARKEIQEYMVERECAVCKGRRLKPEALAVKVGEKSIDKITAMPVSDLETFFRQLGEAGRLSENEEKISRMIVKEVFKRLQFLSNVGLSYLSLNRKTSTLSGGEESRIRLATQLGSQLSGVLYILDEPSVGLHPRDQEKLIKTLKNLRDLQNTVLVVEHDPMTIKESDWVIDLGPGAGKNGGRIMFEGTPKALLHSKTLTGQYLSGKREVKIAPNPQPGNSERQKFLVVKGAKEHNLKDIDAKIPLSKFVCITGVSGSGKSSLMNDILAKALLKKFYRAKKEPGEHKEIIGSEHLDKVVLIDQSPIGRTPRSNPATYTGLFTYIRGFFSKTKEAAIRGYGPGRFSFNVRGGRCEACGGDGVKKIEMYFLPDVYVQCEECKGKRYNKETLQIEYKGKNISQVLETTIEEGLEFFRQIPPVFRKLKVLQDIGLGYVGLGQPAPSLSGGEAQRVKLAEELSKKATGKTLYILDEPTTGLHPHDIKKLVWVLRRLVDRGNTVLLTEHNVDVIKNADWIIDLGPEGGEKGGEIVAQGTIGDIVENKNSRTGVFLK